MERRCRNIIIIIIITTISQTAMLFTQVKDDHDDDVHKADAHPNAVSANGDNNDTDATDDEDVASCQGNACHTVPVCRRCLSGQEAFKAAIVRTRDSLTSSHPDGLGVKRPPRESGRSPPPLLTPSSTLPSDMLMSLRYTSTLLGR